MNELVIATRSSPKMREIRELLRDLPAVRLLDLDRAGASESPAEDGIEAFETFEENALAKARYFSRLLGAAVLADDSGLCVDALGGGPGVRSKRFSGRSDLDGLGLDLANNARLLENLAGLPPDQRGAHYVCVIAVIVPGRPPRTFHGRVDGRILDSPRGTGGFGYDPLFFLPELDATFAQIDPAEKNRRSHRARALAAALPYLRALAESPVSPAFGTSWQR